MDLVEDARADGAVMVLVDGEDVFGAEGVTKLNEFFLGEVAIVVEVEYSWFSR